MEFVIVAIAILTAIAVSDITMPETTITVLTEDEIRREYRLSCAVMAAKFAIRNNIPSGYARASAEMRKYV